MEVDLVYVVPDIPTIAQGDALSASLPGPLDVSVPRVVEPAEIEAGGGIGSLPVPEPTARGNERVVPSPGVEVEVCVW
ncbi:hypothetical protein G5714_024669 [Onychostoma macrolepis]|uniref:Uncharacterized protein n=1 Tax=Onychostoma macrolepis TaxID=369639 RepID=A0A7J6BIB8_9TELE|nr:hypothetical protein G5714_024669 [Onychostoma macrolepis]